MRRRRRRSPVLAAAHRTLDLAREGQPVPDWAVLQALITTGDIDFGEVPMLRIVRAPGTWERGEHGLLRPASWVDVIS